MRQPFQFHCFACSYMTDPMSFSPIEWFGHVCWKAIGKKSLELFLDFSIVFHWSIFILALNSLDYSTFGVHYETKNFFFSQCCFKYSRLWDSIYKIKDWHVCFKEKQAIETLMRAVVSFGDHCHLTIFPIIQHTVFYLCTHLSSILVYYVQIIYLLDYIYSYIF